MMLEQTRPNRGEKKERPPVCFCVSPKASHISLECSSFERDSSINKGVVEAAFVVYCND
jgi:hypothetical protein